MALVQTLMALVGRSLGTVFNAIFGWAVVALFGRTSEREQWLLSALVGAALLWPLLLLGVAVPRVAAFLIAFVPLRGEVSHRVLRIVWASLAFIVPLALGLGLSRRRPAGAPREHVIVSLLRGYPVTLGIATSFLIMFITVPVLRIVSLVKGRRDEHLPCITEEGAYRVVAEQIDATLREHHLDASRRSPPWWLSAPNAVLRALGGPGVRALVPRKLAYWETHALSIALHPSDVVVRGNDRVVGHLSGMLMEATACGPALQTFDAATQALERRLHALWDRAEHPAVAPDDRVAILRDVTHALGELPVRYDDWQSVYRQILQLQRALDHRPPLLASAV